MRELTKIEIERQDFVDNSIYELLQAVNPTDKEINWNIEMLADIREEIRNWFVNRLNINTEKRVLSI